MENCSASLIEAIEHLATAIGQHSNTYVSEILSTVMATVGSVIAVLIFEVIKEHIFTPRKEFKRLRRKVNSTLGMFACYYTHQIDIVTSNAKRLEQYSSASKTIHELAMELMAFADEINSKKCCDVPVSDISEAAWLLNGLSNNFFTPGNRTEDTDNESNDKRRQKIIELLKIDHKR